MEQTIGKRIVANRKRLGLTQDQLAEKLGVTAQAVSKWENDQSCPDISVLPQLARIFSISTDTLLGCDEHTPIIHETQVVEDETQETSGIHIQNGKWEFSLDGGKRGALGLAITLIAVGVLYLLSLLFQIDISFWSILWPTAMLMFGLFGIFRKFSFFYLSCGLVGAYYLANKLIPYDLSINGGMVFAVLIVLFGFSLLMDTLQKSRSKDPTFSYTDKFGKTHHGKLTNDYEVDEDSFAFSASFGDGHQNVSIPILRRGDIDVSFGDFTVDLSSVESVTDDCTVEADCSFGELTVLVPRRYCVKPASSTSFASFTISGQPDDVPTGYIHVQGEASFGQIQIKYI